MPNLLIVDDDSAACRIVQAFAEQAGWHYDLFEEGQAAIKAARTNRYDLVISDLHIPGVDSLQFVKDLKESDPSRAMIVVSGKASIEEVIELLKLGASDFLQKPLSMHALENAIQRVVSDTTTSQNIKTTFEHVVEESTKIEFTTGYLAKHGFVPPIFDRLHMIGKISLTDKMQLILAFQEALANSVEHGNLKLKSEWKDNFDENGLDQYTAVKRKLLSDPNYYNLPVKIEINYTESSLVLKIRDCGEGFMQALSDSQDKNEDSDLKTHGRGISIIRKCVDQVTYAKNGTEVSLTKILGQGGQDVA